MYFGLNLDLPMHIIIIQFNALVNAHKIMWEIKYIQLLYWISVIYKNIVIQPMEEYNH